MVTLDTVYWKFGYASEAAQLLETELINVITEYDMSQGKDIQSLKKQFLEMDKYTLGKLNYALKSRMVEDADTLEYVSDALKARKSSTKRLKSCWESHGCGINVEARILRLT